MGYKVKKKNILAMIRFQKEYEAEKILNELFLDKDNKDNKDKEKN